MPGRSKRVCPGCGLLYDRECECGHGKQGWQSDKQRGTRQERGYDLRWERLRKWYTARHKLCEECLSRGKIAEMETLDHIVPFKTPDNPLRLDPNNVQSLCRACHEKKTTRESHGEPYMSARYVVTGPPGSGKTTWVEQHRQAGDLVWDLDAVADAIAHTPRHPRPEHVYGATEAMRIALLDWLHRHREARCMVIVTDRAEAEHVARQIGAEIHACIA